MKKKRRGKKAIRLYIALFLASIIVLPLLIVVYFLNQKSLELEDVIIKIEKNASTKFIVQQFNKYGGLEPKAIFLPLIRFYSLISGKFPVSGTYKFTPRSSNLEIIRSIYAGQNLVIVKVTYPEGITVRDFALITHRHLGIDTFAFYKAIEKGNYLEKLKIPINSLEGYLMPETYYFYYETDPRTVVEKLVETQNKIWYEKFDHICKEKGLSRHFILTLASIIELESPLKTERKRISGVFYNRIDKGMKLESDPTVQYAISKKRKLKYSDLSIESPYNTYYKEGLPPGPICSPSVESIEAAIFPERHKFLYFVSIGDGSGRHRFAENFQEHLKNKRLFKQALKKQSSTSN
ncbi:MAG: endolytic transglycosylase MltG [Candidatus Kapaibacteriota bacterium]